MLKWNHIEAMMKMNRISEEWVNLYGTLWSKEDVDKIYEESENCIMEILKYFATPKPFVLKAVKELKERGIGIGSTTGYTDKMMEVVVPSAKEQGYEPEFWCSPNSTNDMGRPYPYMAFKNMEYLKVKDVRNVIKVGDTVADIKEGKQCGAISVGVIDGSSIMSLSEEEFNELSKADLEVVREEVSKVFFDCGADFVINDMSELIGLIDELEA